MAFLFGGKKTNTFKPKKNIGEDSRQFKMLKIAEATLGSGDLKQAVALPKGEDLDEWLAFNVVDFYNQINVIYGTLAGRCTDTTCPLMCAGKAYEYMWADVTTKKPIKVSAPKYMDLLMNWIQEQLDDEAMFPSKIGIPFPKTFQTTVKNIFKRLFRVYAHIYHEHFNDIKELQEEPHLNTSFKHFIFFINEFTLIEKRELAPLQDLINRYDPTPTKK